LKIIFRKDVRHWSSSIELFWSLIEELLHEINELIVVFCIDSRVFDDEASIGLECFGYSFTVLSVVSWLSEECLDVYDGDRDVWAEEVGESV
jgi:hypothetical protein